MLKTDMEVLFLKEFERGTWSCCTSKNKGKKQFQLPHESWNDRVWLEWPSESLGRSLLGQCCALAD
jgi:hypothetical protein